MCSWCTKAECDKLAWACAGSSKKVQAEVDGIGSVKNQLQSLAQLGLKIYWDIRADLSLGLGSSGISELISAQAQKEVELAS